MLRALSTENLLGDYSRVCAGQVTLSGLVVCLTFLLNKYSVLSEGSDIFVGGSL